MYFHKTNRLVQRFFPAFTWQIPTQEKVVYLTFDDGPVPEVTEYVLDALASYQARATFFCVGENVARYPALFRRVLAGGHRVGNHTYNHLNGWRTPDETYFDNVQRCASAMRAAGYAPNPAARQLFRPPYGRITRDQTRLIQPTHQIVMWDVLTADFDAQLSAEQCYARAIQHTEPGSLVIFHDSYKARRNLEYALPRYLRTLHQRGYTFLSLPA